MASATLLSVEDYLRTSFPDGDREYLEGELLEKNMGEFDHCDIQSTILAFLRSHYPNCWSGVEMRNQVKQRRFRVPDVCLTLNRPTERILTNPPFLVVEVLSPDDRMSEMQERIDDYLEFGVPYVWIVDPLKHKAFVYTSEASREVKDGMLRTADPVIEVPLNALF